MIYIPRPHRRTVHLTDAQAADLLRRAEGGESFNSIAVAMGLHCRRVIQEFERRASQAQINAYNQRKDLYWDELRVALILRREAKRTIVICRDCWAEGDVEGERCVKCLTGRMRREVVAVEGGGV